MSEKENFTEALIKFEALAYSPLKEAFGGIAIDRQVELLDGLVADVQSFAKVNNLEFPTRKTWVAFQKQANWNSLAKSALTQKNIVSQVKEMFGIRI